MNYIIFSLTFPFLFLVGSIFFVFFFFCFFFLSVYEVFFTTKGSQFQRNDLIRTCFQIEQAHWYYVDFFCKDKEFKSQCPDLGQRDFMKFAFCECSCKGVRNL